MNLGFSLLRYRNGGVRFIWKFILLVLFILVFTFIIAFPLSVLHLNQNKYINWIAVEISIVLAVLFLNRFFSSDQERSLGLAFKKGWLVALASGFAFAAIAVTVLFSVELFSGQLEIVQVNGTQWSALALKGLTLFAAVGLAEEIMSRGFAIKNLRLGYNPPIAMVLSSLIFAALHFSNSHFNWLAFCNTTLVGLILAYVFIKTGSLWWPIGYHMAWNLFVGVIYGLPVSGVIVSPIIKSSLKAPSILNGGKYGPEGGLLVTLVLLVTMVILWLKYQNKEEQI